MEKIASFTVDHLTLEPAYTSRASTATPPRAPW